MTADVDLLPEDFLETAGWQKLAEKLYAIGGSPALAALAEFMQPHANVQQNYTVKVHSTFEIYRRAARRIANATPTKSPLFHAEQS